MKRRSRFRGAQPSLPMIVPPGFEGFVPLDSVALLGEQVKITDKALLIPTAQLVNVNAVLERTVVYADERAVDGAQMAMARRSQIAVRPQDVVHGIKLDPERPWKEPHGQGQPS